MDKLRTVDVPEGESGDWRVSRFDVNEADASLHNMRESMHRSCRFINPGVYTRLTRHNNVIMSDTQAEIQDHREPAIHAHNGRVLVNGLGIGVVLQAVLEEPTVEHLIVIEKSRDVIKLVADHWQKRYGNRLTVVHADAFDWKPPKNTRYCVVWHDIWDSITADNLPEMHRLHRKYGRRCDWQGSWCRWMCEKGK